VTEDSFGSYDDVDQPGKKQVVRRFTLENDAGMKVQVLNYGATLFSIIVPDSTGKPVDVVLGFADIAGYLGGRNPYFGAAIGRVANRIEKGKFKLGNQEYTLEINNGENTLHGGLKGFDKRIWETRVEGSKLVLNYTSADGEGGYPGAVQVEITYELTPANELKTDYKATTTKPTPIVLTNHSYFNLSGHTKSVEKLKGHFIQINADHYTPVNDSLIPTGEIKSVTGSAFDFRTTKDLGELLAAFPAGPNGYDVNFCVNQAPGQELNQAATVKSEDSKISLTVLTNQPGIQFYTGNFLPDPVANEEPLPGKNSAKYYKHGAFCLETQTYPNAVNQANFPNAVLNPGETYNHTTVFKFGTSGK